MLLVLYCTYIRSNFQKISQIAMNAEQTKCEPDTSKARKEKRANLMTNHSQHNCVKREVGLAIKEGGSGPGCAAHRDCIQLCGCPAGVRQLYIVY